MAEADIASRFREACSRFTTGVAVATARTPSGKLEGVTINSFTSVSLHPPMVLFCLDNRAGSLAGFDAAAHFAVNILSREQQQLCTRFASIGMHDKFDGVALEGAEDDPPLFPGALAQFLCRTAAKYPGGDHTIFLGEVERIALNDGDPLVYHASDFKLLR